MYDIYETSTFTKQKRKLLSKAETIQYENTLKRLKNNPFQGDALGRKYFRELKIKGKRLYFLIYEDLVLVLFIALSDKKTQQSTIDAIKRMMPLYYEIAKKYAKQHV